MCAQQDNNRDLVNTTDCLEAIGVFKCWKNIFFLITIICMLLLAACFWVVHLGLISDADSDNETVAQAQIEFISEPVEPAAEVAQAVDDTTAKIEAAAKEVAGDPNAAVAEVPVESARKIDFKKIVKPVHIMWTIRAIDFILIAAAMLYCLTLLFTFKVSLVGRLGGINHIARAVMLSLIFIILLLPWQEVFGWFVYGIMFSPGELMDCAAKYDAASSVGKGLYFTRFVAYWLLGLLILLCTQARAGRWSKATLKRLEVI